jgi:hypothetical protein
MVNWAEKAAANMLHLSMTKNLAIAMREWSTTGGYEDSHSIDEICELCEHEGLYMDSASFASNPILAGRFDCSRISGL